MGAALFNLHASLDVLLQPHYVRAAARLRYRGPPEVAEASDRVYN
jgi:hypothetical protein